MEDIFQLILRTYGIAGLLILLPVLASVVLWKANREMQDKLLAQTTVALDAQKSRVEDQSRRVEDTERMMQKLLDVIREQTALNAETNAALERLASSVDKLERHAMTASNGNGGRR